MFKPAHERTPLTHAFAPAPVAPANENVVPTKRSFLSDAELRPIQQAEQQRQLAKNQAEAKLLEDNLARYGTGMAYQPKRRVSQTYEDQARMQGAKGMAFKL